MKYDVLQFIMFPYIIIIRNPKDITYEKLDASQTKFMEKYQQIE